MIIKLICIWLKVAIQIFASQRYMFVDCLWSEPQTITQRTSIIKKLFILINVNWCANKAIDVKVYQTGTVDDYKFILQKKIVPSSSQTISHIDIGFFLLNRYTRWLSTCSPFHVFAIYSRIEFYWSIRKKIFLTSKYFSIYICSHLQPLEYVRNGCLWEFIFWLQGKQIDLVGCGFS